jgi:hypothetical protein
MYNMRVVYLTTIICAVIVVRAPAVRACGRGAIFIKDNEYRGMVIAISDTVPENRHIIARLKEVFTEASAYLYQATR